MLICGKISGKKVIRQQKTLTEENFDPKPIVVVDVINYYWHILESQINPTQLMVHIMESITIR